MNPQSHIDVAVLLATYNGARYVEQQIRSLKDNSAEFTLHWLDDHSTDNTRRIVLEVSLDAGVPLRHWHYPHHLGVPATFFQLVESVEADIYLFCDQDDIWQPGKIDALVNSLTLDMGTPVLSFSEPMVFRDDEPTKLRKLSDLWTSLSMQESRMFMPICFPGHTFGFTRALRDVFLRHAHIARSYAYMHDWWFYNIAAATGLVRFLPNAPTTLYRHHRRSFTGTPTTRRPDRTIWAWLLERWRTHQEARLIMAKHARGFVLASETMPPAAKLDRFCEIARIIATADRRQHPTLLLRLAGRHALWRNWSLAAWFVIVCLCSNAESSQ